MRAIFVAQAALDEAEQDTRSHARLQVSKRRRIEFAGGMKADARSIVRGDGRLEYAVDNAVYEQLNGVPIACFGETEYFAVGEKEVKQ